MDTNTGTYFILSTNKAKVYGTIDNIKYFRQFARQSQ